jgi:two-component system response regulator YesN
MNALLVDDDRFVVAALEKKINWEQLTISLLSISVKLRKS